jgi:inner membrane protein involved in colicin E2 resistance
MFITGAALIILALFLTIFSEEIPFTPVVFQVFAANIVIILGLFLFWKLEIRNIIFGYLIDISYIIAVLIVFGLVFDWYSAIPVWVLVVMAVVIYAFAMIITVTRINRDVDELNKLLQNHKKKQDGAAS